LCVALSAFGLLERDWFALPAFGHVQRNTQIGKRGPALHERRFKARRKALARPATDVLP
jgi:hypothetical protein